VPRVSTVRIVLWAALGLLVLCGAVFGLSEVLHRDRTTRTIIADRVHRIVVTADAGDVDIRAGLTANVVVERKDSYLLARPSVSEQFANGELAIKTTCPGLAGALRCRSDVTIDAPPEVDVVVHTKSGDIDLRGLDGRADVRTDAGDITAQRLDPVTIQAAADAGDVSLDLFGQPARTVAHSDAGDVKVTVPFGPYHIDARARSGHVNLKGVLRDDLAPQSITAQSDAGDVTVSAR
jgi:hypothetical protein